MSATTITLSSPQDYNLQRLAETTRQSLLLLKPWALLNPTQQNPLHVKIRNQAINYTAAIQAGVSAAYSGFTVTEEVLFLASSLPIEDREDLQRYLVGMMELAKEARDNANKAYRAFRDVRKEIYALTSQSEQGRRGDRATVESEAAQTLPRYGKDDLEVLVKFSEHINAFADWWDWISVETDPLAAEDQPISFQIDSLRDPEVIRRWNHLRSQYTAYVQMISEIEDAHPQIFSLSLPSVRSAEDSSAKSQSFILDDGPPIHEQTLFDGPRPTPVSPSPSTVQTTRIRKAGARLAKGKDILCCFVADFTRRHGKLPRVVKVFRPFGVITVAGMLASGFKQVVTASTKKMTLKLSRRPSPEQAPQADAGEDHVTRSGSFAAGGDSEKV